MSRFVYILIYCYLAIRSYPCLCHTVYTMRSKSFRTDIFKNRRHTRKTHTFFFFFKIQNKLHWHTHRLLHSCTVSEKLPKMALFGPSLIYQSGLLGSQQHPYSGVLLTSLSTWGTENRLAEINLDSRWSDKGFNIFLGSKIGKHLQLCGQAHYCTTRTNLERRT